jgi:predicted AAA+ superfamily ATPase
MEQQDVQSIIKTYHNFLSTVTLDYIRPLMHVIDWEDKLIEIKGSKGVGKTTLILQHILQTFSNVDDALYVSLDNLWFKSYSLKELADWFYAQGGRYLFLDEVHYYPHWQTAIKNLTDEADNCWAVIDTDGTAIAREHWDGTNWEDDDQFSDKAKAIAVKNRAEAFVTVVDIHD